MHVKGNEGENHYILQMQTSVFSDVITAQKHQLTSDTAPVTTSSKSKSCKRATGSQHNQGSQYLSI